MNSGLNLRKILNRLVSGQITLEEAEKTIKTDYIERIGEIACLDLNREIRSGIPEAVMAYRKEPKILIKIVEKVVEKKGIVLITRLKKKHLNAIKTLEEKGLKVEINRIGKIAIVKNPGFQIEKTGGKIAVITAGSSDLPIAEEVKTTAELMGCDVITAQDVGIAGIHRLIEPLKQIIAEEVECIVVIAGMEGALPSVIAGLVDIPVIGVPTSTGYGLGEKGIGALTTMLQSCSPGLVIVNIDNGFGAGATAALIAKQCNCTNR